MRSMWWKYLSIIILIYVVIMGLSTPLKPGITSVSKLNVKAGSMENIQIEGYNTRFADADNRVWLKLNDSYAIRARQVAVADNNRMTATFKFPAETPISAKNAPLTLIIDNEVQGPAIMPSAMFINGTEGKSGDGWKAPIDKIHDLPGIQFPYRNILNETIRNTFFHIPLWFSMFILLVASLWYSVKYLRKQHIKDDIYASCLIRVAVLFGVMGITTGSIWARFTWGTFWTDDIKLNMATVAMLIYVAYIILRSSISDVDRRAKISAGYAIFAFIALVPLVFVIPRLTDSLHPGNGGNPALGGEDMENTLRMVFYPAIIGLTLLGLWFTSLLIRYELLQERLIDDTLNEG